MKSSNMSPPSFQICFIILIFQICDLMFAKIQWLFHNIPSRSKGLKLCQLNLQPANLFWDQWTVEKQIRYWGYGIWITSLLLKLASTETSFLPACIVLKDIGYCTAFALCFTSHRNMLFFWGQCYSLWISCQNLWLITDYFCNEGWIQWTWLTKYLLV